MKSAHRFPLVFAVMTTILFTFGSVPCRAGLRRSNRDTADSRVKYLAKVNAYEAHADQATGSPGSIWDPDAPLGDVAVDYKARSKYDNVTILVIQQTSAQSNGSLNGERATNNSSAITALPAHVSTGGVNPLIGMQADQKLKGTGQSSSDSSVRTTLTGRVIGVLHNGYLVVEGNREVAINGQREFLTIRGIVRPGDISPSNTVASTLLSELEIELRGKGVVSDFTRPPNPFAKVLMWFLGF